MATQASFRFLPYAPREVLAEVRRRHFPELRSTIPIVFESGRTPLARISPTPAWCPRIYLNRALDRPDTPAHVLAHIFVHELIHLEVEPVRIGPRRWNAHPERFWERERQLSPEAPLAMDWLSANLGHCIDHREQGIWVCPTPVRRR